MKVVYSGMGNGSHLTLARRLTVLILEIRFGLTLIARLKFEFIHS
jgi:hypothetical protein